MSETLQRRYVVTERHMVSESTTSPFIKICRNTKAVRRRSVKVGTTVMVKDGKKLEGTKKG